MSPGEFPVRMYKSFQDPVWPYAPKKKMAQLERAVVLAASKFLKMTTRRRCCCGAQPAEALGLQDRELCGQNLITDVCEPKRSS